MNPAKKFPLSTRSNKNFHGAKIGIFDSGLGGLFIARSIIKRLPRYDYVYLGDTARLPYGDLSQAKIYAHLKEAADFLFERGCKLIIVACNTISAAALRKIQKEFLPRHYPDRRILGVIVPTIEEVAAHSPQIVGVLSTKSTAKSRAYKKEIAKIKPRIQVIEMPAPRIVPLLENGKLKEAKDATGKYITPLLSQKIDSLILGCTHYGILKREVRKIAGPGVRIFSQEEIIPKKLFAYLAKHPEIRSVLGQTAGREFLVTRRTKHFDILARKWFGADIKLHKIAIFPE
jgi:glutamate racemase